jgi:hypothetical protein
MRGISRLCWVYISIIEFRAASSITRRVNAPGRLHWIHAKNEALQTRRKEEKEWIGRYMVYWNCYQPQDICGAADPEYEETEYRFPDMVMPLYYGVYKRAAGSDWL